MCDLTWNNEVHTLYECTLDQNSFFTVCVRHLKLHPVFLLPGRPRIPVLVIREKPWVQFYYIDCRRASWALFCFSQCRQCHVILSMQRETISSCQSIHNSTTSTLCYLPCRWACQKKVFLRHITQMYVVFCFGTQYIYFFTITISQNTQVYIPKRFTLIQVLPPAIMCTPNSL